MQFMIYDNVKANYNVSGLATYAFWPAVHFCISRGLYSPIKHIFFHSLILFVKLKSNLIYYIRTLTINFNFFHPLLKKLPIRSRC